MARQQVLEQAALGRRLSVTAYLAGGFAACLLAVTALVGTASLDDFRRERDRTDAELLAAAQANADFHAELVPQVEDLFANLAAAPEIAGFDPAGCGAVFAGLASGIAEAHIHLVDSSGTERCSIDDPEVGHRPYPIGPWFEQAREADGPVWMAPSVDPLSGETAVEVAQPIVSPDGSIGVLLGVLYTGQTDLVLQPGIPGDTVLIAVDGNRELVLATTADPPVAPNTLAPGSALSRVRPGRTTTLRLGSGERWLFTEQPVEGLGWHVLAGRRESAALAPARSSRNRIAGFGAGTVLLVAALGLVLHRHVGRPVARLGHVVERSWHGDGAVASVSGLREVARLAHRFNGLMDERRAREADLRWRATHDGLTGLLNRAAIADRLTELLVTTHGGELAVLFLDLDRFKLVNDSYGHPVGDQLLVTLTGRLTDVVGDANLVGRFGGDEFVVLAEGLGAEDLGLLAQRLIDAVRAPVTVEGHEFFVSGCIGIAYARTGESADDLIRNADTAMYGAKQIATGRVATFDVEMRRRSVLRHTVEQDLHRAVERQELELHYQPVVDIDSGHMVGAEALVRWRHPERGLIPPCEFIPVAEESGLILDLGKWVLHRAVADAARWQRSSPRPLTIAVNVAAGQLATGDLAGLVAAELSTAGLDPGRLGLEVTESGVLQDPELASEILGQLRAMGVTVSIDDFGTGYSSLSYIQQLPLDVIKIDQSFVARLDLDGASTQIVRSVVELAHALDLRVVGEGVETERQLDNLRRIGCDRAQGYLLARPQPAIEIDRLLAAGSILGPARTARIAGA